MEDFKLRKQVSFDQLKALIEFLKEHQELAKGLVRGRRGKLHTLKLWNLCAKKLNTVQDGATKAGKGWSKYWCDWKYRVRRRALELKAAKDSNRPPPDGVTPLSYLEEDILDIIGESNMEGVIIKCDPLSNGDTEEDPDTNEANDDASVNQIALQTRPILSRKRRYSFREDMDESPGASCSPEKKPKVKNGCPDEDMDVETTEFLRLEREKIDNSKKMYESIQTMTSEITRLTDVISNIRDVLINSTVNM